MRCTTGPLAGAARLRSFRLLQALCRRFEVGLVCTSDEPIYSNQRAALEELTGGQTLIHRVYGPVNRLRQVAAMGRAKSMAAAMRFRPVLAREISFWHNHQPFDVVLTVGCTMLPYARILAHPGCRQPAVKRPPARHLLDVSSRDAIRWYEYAARARPPRRWICAAEARRLGRIETGNADLFDAVLFYSEAAKMVCHRLGARSQSAVVVPNGVDLDTVTPSPLGDDRTILCLGPARERPDLCGPRWFADFVLPLLQYRVPRARLTMVVDTSDAGTRDLACRLGVHVVDDGSDVRSYLHQAALFGCPTGRYIRSSAANSGSDGMRQGGCVRSACRDRFEGHGRPGLACRPSGQSGSIRPAGVPRACSRAPSQANRSPCPPIHRAIPHMGPDI